MSDHLQPLPDNWRDLFKKNDTNNTSLDGIEFETTVKVTEQIEYVWIRLRLSSDNPFKEEMIPGDKITINYQNEKLETFFYLYDKQNAKSNLNNQEEVQNYSEEEDYSTLILNCDLKKIRFESEGFPTLRKLFRQGRHFEEIYLPLAQIRVDLEKDEESKTFDNVITINF